MSAERLFCVTFPRAIKPSEMSDAELLNALQLNRLVVDNDCIRLHEALYNELRSRFIKRADIT